MRYRTVGVIRGFLFRVDLQGVMVDPRRFRRVLRRTTNDAENKCGLRSNFLPFLVYVPYFRVVFRFVFNKDRSSLFGEDNYVRLRG